MDSWAYARVGDKAHDNAVRLQRYPCVGNSVVSCPTVYLYDYTAAYVNRCTHAWSPGAVVPTCKMYVRMTTCS